MAINPTQAKAAFVKMAIMAVEQCLERHCFKISKNNLVEEGFDADLGDAFPEVQQHLKTLGYGMVRYNPDGLRRPGEAILDVEYFEGVTTEIILSSDNQVVRDYLIEKIDEHLSSGYRRVSYSTIASIIQGKTPGRKILPRMVHEIVREYTAAKWKVQKNVVNSKGENLEVLDFS